MDIAKISIARLSTAPYNPRVDLSPGDPVYENLRRSVETFGCVQPIVVNRRSNVVVGGHQRLKVLEDLGYETVDVVFVDLPEEREKALNLALNKIVGEWDEPKLAQLLQEFEGFPDVDVQLAGFDAGEAVGAYKELDTVEFGFRDLKDVIEMRPVYHKTDDRINAHIFVATIALFLKRSLEHQLAPAFPELSATEAIAAMRSIGLAELDLNGQTTRLVSGGSRDARRVLIALCIVDRNPPRSRTSASKPPETAMY